MFNIQSILQKITTKKIVNIQQTDYLGTATNSEGIILIFKKKIQLFASDYTMTAQIFINQKIKQYSLFQNSFFILYQNKNIQRRLFDDWQNPIIIQSRPDIQSIRAFDEKRLILKYNKQFVIKQLISTQLGNTFETLINVKIDQDDIRDIIFQLENRGKSLNICYIWNEDKIKKCMIEKIGLLCTLQIKLEAKIEHIFIYKTDNQELLNYYDPQYLVTIDSNCIICFYDIFANSEIPTFSTQLYETKNNENKIIVNYDAKNKFLWLWLENQSKIISIQLHKYIKIHKQNVKDKFIKKIKKVTTQGSFIGSIGQNPLINNKNQLFVLLNMQKQQQWEKKEKEEIKEKIQIMKEKSLIKYEMLNYSRKIQNLKSVLIQTEEQKIISKQFQQKGTQKQQEIITKNDFQIQTEQVTQQKQLQEQQKQEQKLDIRIPIQQQSVIVERKLSMGVQAVQTNQSLGVQVVENIQANLFSDAEIQTQQNEYDQQYLNKKFQIKFIKLQNGLRQEISSRYQNLIKKLSFTKQELSNQIMKAVNQVISNQFKIHLTETLLPKMQKYFSITFSKINQTFQKGIKYYNEQIIKEQIKMNEINKEIIQKNRLIVQKMLVVLKQAVTRLDKKKQEITKMFENKFQQLNIISSQVESINKQLENLIKSQDGIQLRIQATTNKIITEITKHEKNRKKQERQQNNIHQIPNIDYQNRPQMMNIPPSIPPNYGYYPPSFNSQLPYNSHPPGPGAYFPMYGYPPQSISPLNLQPNPFYGKFDTKKIKKKQKRKDNSSDQQK